jgi:hypothetical protein
MKNIFYISVLVMLFNNIINAQVYCVDVNPGWNLIGAVITVDTALVWTEPIDNIFKSPWYGWNGGFFAPSTLVKGYGYWIKIDYGIPNPTRLCFPL